MSRLLDIALFAAGINIILLGVLGFVWIRNYRLHRAAHTLGLIVFGAFLFVQNVLWFYFYRFHPEFISWFINSGTDIQIGMTLLCGLETIALLVLFRITWV